MRIADSNSRRDRGIVTIHNRILYCPEQSPGQLRCQPPLHKGAFVPTAEDAHDGTLRHILFCTKQIARKVFVSYRIKLDKER